MDPFDGKKHPRSSGLEHLTTEELLERLRNANHPPQPDKQTLEEYISEQEKAGEPDFSGNDPGKDSD